MLKALVDGEPSISCDLDDDAWVALQRDDRAARRKRHRLIICSECGGPVHTAKLATPYLTQFFAHDPGSADRCELMPVDGETNEHRSLKVLIHKTVRSTKGWMSDVEARLGPDVRVDVLGTRLADRTKTGKRAFEVELKAGTVAEVLERNDAREQYVDQCHWITRGARPWADRVRSYQIERFPDGTDMVVAGVSTWVGNAYDGNFQPADPLTLQRLTKLVLGDRMVWAEGFGLLDRTELDKAKGRINRPSKRPGPGWYVADHCVRPKRLSSGSPNVDRIIAELDAHYMKHPDQWPEWSWRAQRLKGQENYE